MSTGEGYLMTVEGSSPIDPATEKLIRRVLRSAWVLLMFCSATSMAGSVYYAAVHGSGTIAAMSGMGSVAIVLWLAMHLHGGVNAARRVMELNARAARSAATGVVILVGIALAASFFTLHSLMTAEGVHAVTAVLIPAALDVGVVVSTIVIFALDAALTRDALKQNTQPADTPVTQPMEHFAAHQEAPRDAPVERTMTQESHAPEAPMERPVTQIPRHPDAPHEPATAHRNAVHDAPKAPPVKRPDAFVLTTDADQLAVRIASETTISLPTRTISAVLKRAAAGESQRKIAAALKGVSPTTAGRVVTAARELDGECEPEPLILTAAG